MWRYWVGAAIALVLVGGGVLWWHNNALARQESTARAGNAFAPADVEEGDAGTPAPPVASERTREEKRFGRADHDKNGAISRDEYLAARHRNFAKLDANQDGTLSFDEYAAKAQEKFAKADGDHNGALNPAEFATTRVVRKSRPTCACDRRDEDGQ